MRPRASHMLGALCHRTTPLQQGSMAGFKRHYPSVFCSLSLLVFLFKRYILIGWVATTGSPLIKNNPIEHCSVAAFPAQKCSL